MSSYYQSGGRQRRPQLPATREEATLAPKVAPTPGATAPTVGPPPRSTEYTPGGATAPEPMAAAPTALPPVVNWPEGMAAAAGITLPLTLPASVAPPVETAPQPDPVAEDPLAPGDEAGAEFQLEGDQMWDDVMSQWKDSGKNNEAIAQAAQASAGRRAAGMNASLGRSVGGGFMGGMAQAALTGQRERMSLEQEHQKQGMELKMTYLQNLLKQAEASKDRDLQVEIQNMIGQTMMDMKAIENGAQVPTDDGPPEPIAVTSDDGATLEGEEAWDKYSSLDPVGQYTISRTHMSEELPIGGGGTLSIDDIIDHLNISWQQADADQRRDAVNYMWGYYLRENELPSRETVLFEGLHQGWWEL